MASFWDIRTGRCRVFDSVFVTKYRHPVFTAAHLDRMEQIMRDVCRDFECELAELNGEANHVHLLVRFAPKIALSRLVNTLKGMSSQAAAGVPGPAQALLAGKPAVVRLVLRRIRRRRPDHGPSPVRRAAGPPRLTSARVRLPSPPAQRPTHWRTTW
jgi:putative transposase